ncbi:MAG: hypothetical protein F7B20_04045 [Aeropyrum sp.]|nr:hypothetical protein [Aeropyrum sp.]
MRIEFGLLMAALTAALTISESNAVKLLDSMIPGHMLIAKIVMTAVTTIGSYWGLVIASSRFRSAHGRRLILLAAGIIGGVLVIVQPFGSLAGGASIAELIAISLLIGMSGFALSTTIYNQVDYVHWKKTLAEYYVVSVVGSSTLVLLALMTGSIVPIAAAILLAAIASSKNVTNVPIPFSSLKVLDNFATTLKSALQGRAEGLRLDEVVRLSSAVGVMASLKISAMQEASAALGELTPLVYSLGYAIGVTLAASIDSTLAASTAALLATALYIGLDSGLPWLDLSLIGMAYGWSVLALVTYVLDRAPKKVRIASVSSVFWTVTSILVVFASTITLGVNPSIPALAILGAGLIVSGLIRAFHSSKVSWY